MTCVKNHVDNIFHANFGIVGMFFQLFAYNKNCDSEFYIAFIYIFHIN